MKKIKVVVEFPFDPGTNALLMKRLINSLANAEYGIKYAVPSFAYKLSRDGRTLTILVSYAVPFGVLHKIDQFFYSLLKLRAVLVEIYLNALLNDAKVLCGVNGKRLTIRGLLRNQRDELDLLFLGKHFTGYVELEVHNV